MDTTKDPHICQIATDMDTVRPSWLKRNRSLWGWRIRMVSYWLAEQGVFKRTENWLFRVGLRVGG
jgi:hypothetical protein